MNNENIYSLLVICFQSNEGFGFEKLALKKIKEINKGIKANKFLNSSNIHLITQKSC